MTITDFPTSSEGSAFRVKITAFNSGGRQADSSSQTFILASVPDTPTDSSVSDTSVTSSSVIKVSYGTTPSFNGNCPILSYSLEIDDGLGGNYTKLIGYTSNSLITSYTISSGIIKGREYKLRYRVKNNAGWSDYSSIGFVLAANVPSIPPKPIFSYFNSDTLYLLIQPPKDMLVEQLGLHHLKPQFQLSIHLHKQWILTGIDPVWTWTALVHFRTSQVRFVHAEWNYASSIPN